MQASLFDDARTAIDGKLASSSGEALEKIDSISERLRDGDAEAISQAMSTCRRLIDAVADTVFAPQDEPYVIGEQPLSMKADKVLNRINAAVHQCGVSGDRAVRIRQTLAGVYGRTSKGVHSDVDANEARYVFPDDVRAPGRDLDASGRVRELIRPGPSLWTAEQRQLRHLVPFPVRARVSELLHSNECFNQSALFDGYSAGASKLWR